MRNDILLKLTALPKATDQHHCTTKPAVSIFDLKTPYNLFIWWWKATRNSEHHVVLHQPFSGFRHSRVVSCEENKRNDCFARVTHTTNAPWKKQILLCGLFGIFDSDIDILNRPSPLPPTKFMDCDSNLDIPVKKNYKHVVINRNLY